VVGREIAKIATAFADTLACAPLWKHTSIWSDFALAMNTYSALIESDADETVSAWLQKGSTNQEHRSSLDHDEEERIRWGTDGGNNCD